MDEKEQYDKICRYLRIIERTRLLYNTSEELAALVGFSLKSGNGLKRMGGKSLFMKGAVFRELAYKVREWTDGDVDLQQVLDSYILTDKIAERYCRSGKTEICRALIRHYYGHNEADEIITTICKHIKQEDVPILILRLIGALPKLSARGGDVTDIDDSFKITFNLLDEELQNWLVEKNFILENAKDYYKEEAEDKKRIELIRITMNSLYSYGSISTPEHAYDASRELSKKEIKPDIEGYWEVDGNTYVYWYIEMVENGYFLYRIEVDNGKRSFVFERYEMKLFDMGTYTQALIINPQVVRDITNNTKTPYNRFGYYEMELNGNELTFEALPGNELELHIGKMRRSKRQQQLDDMFDRYEATSKFEGNDYVLMPALYAITEEHVYLKDNDDNVYYKIPKSLSPALNYVRFGDVIGIAQFNDGSLYAAFTECGLFYNISNTEEMRKRGISKESDVKID